uniref:Peptidase S1 domain-containing protein n=1 Tax=Laticauda laticaudata TaxID=8630 RepID=A0A8C5WUR9_LATLA
SILPHFLPLLLSESRVCGGRPLAMSHGMLRIVGGVDSLPGTWPWAVSFQFPTREGYRHFCAGSLINSHWVISTAPQHLCLSPTPLSIRNNLIIKLVDHKNYDKEKHLNNIALVELDKPVVCNDYVQPACLPEGDLVVDLLTHCYICGWGITVMEMQEGELCPGDGGGPLMCRQSHTERYWLIGLNSWGTSCSTGKVPGIFTSTQFFLTWVKDILANPPASGLSPPFRPTTPRTPSPPPPSRFTGAYYLDPIYKKVNGMLVGYFPEANTYSLPTRQWRPAVRRTTWPWYTGPPRTFSPFTFYPLTTRWPTPTTAFLGWGKGPSIIYRLPRRRFTAVPHTTHFRWPRPQYWNRPKF